MRDAQRGDEAAFRTLYRAIQPSLVRYLRALVGPRAQDVEDIASEAWLQVARDLATFRGNGDGFRGWVTTIARNRVIDHRRRQGRRPLEYEPMEQLPDRPSGSDTATSALDAAATDAALALIARLPADQAEAVLLRVVMGLDAKAAGEVLGKRAGAVRTAAHRGLKRLAEYLGNPHHPEHHHPEHRDSGHRDSGHRDAGYPAGPGAATPDDPARTRGFPAGVTPTRASTLREVR